MEAQTTLPPHQGLKKGLYLIPSAFTAANIGMGFIAILNSMRGFLAIKTDPQNAFTYFNAAAIAIGFAILFDTLDGRIARMTRTSSEIGVQLDSLADVLTFGIAPVALAYGWGIGSTISDQSAFHGIAVFVLFMYLMCGAFRLARFNVQASRPKAVEEGHGKLDRKNFVGLPIPPAAGLIASIVHFTPTPLGLREMGSLWTPLFVALIASLGLLMVSTIRYASFKSTGTGKQNMYPLLFIAGLGMLIWFYSEWVLLIISVTYVSHGILWLIVRFAKGKSREKLAPHQIED